MRRNGHKFNAKATVIDGIRFASQAEAARYAELKLLAKAGQISELVLQPRYGLNVGNNRRVLIGEYRGDFYYLDRDGDPVVEDVKGFKTPLYRWKKKHFEAQYGIAITEITRS
jgi:hypothetical protein